MSVYPPEQMRSMREAAEKAAQPAGSLAQRWEDLHLQADKLAKLAQLAPAQSQAGSTDFASALGASEEWQRELAWQSIEDIDAMMKPGLTALNVLVSRGLDANAPALALWREFHAAREGVLHVLATERRSKPRL